jgi:membrane protein required for colicin V production
MIWIDLGIVVVLTLMAILGYRRGLVRQIVELFGLILGLFLGLYLTAGLVDDFGGPFKNYRLTQPVVFMLIVGATIAVSAVAGRVASEVVTVSFFGWFDQLGGAIAGTVKGALWLSVLITVVMHVGLSPKVESHLTDATLVKPIAGLLPAAFDVVQAYAENTPLRVPFDSAVR